MATIENFILKFKVEGSAAVNALKDDLKDLAANANPLAGTFSNLAGGMGLMATGALAAAGAFAALGMKAINLADDIQDMADATGIGAGQLLNLRNSLVQAGGDAESFVQVANKLALSIGESMSGNEKFQKSFKDLGVVIRDGNGNLRDTGDILQDTIRGLAAISDPAIRASKAVELLGKEASKINWANVSAGKDAIKDEQIAQLAKYREAIDTLRVGIDDALLTAFGKLAIAVQSVDWTGEKQKAADYMKTLGAISPMLKMFGIGLEANAAKSKQAELMQPYKSRAGVGREPAPTPAGDQGPQSEAALAKLKTERERAAKEAADMELRIFKSKENAKRDTLLQFTTDEEQAAEVRAQSQIREAQRTITNAKELAAKITEIEAARDLDINKFRNREQEKAAAEQKRLAERAAEQVKKLNETAGTQIAQYAAETTLLKEKLSLQQEIAGLSTIEADRRTKIAEAARDQAKLLATIIALPEDKRLQREQEINAEYDKRIKLINEEANVRQARDKDFAAGFKETMKRYEESMTPLKQGAAVAESVYSNMGSSLDKFVETGKFSFKDFANSIIMDLLKIQLRAAATQLFSAAASSFGFTLPGRAVGGPVTAGQPYIVGEQGPELFLPNTGGTVMSNGSLNSMGRGGGGGTTTVINNISAIDAKSVAQLFAENRMTLLGTVESARRELPMRTR